MVSLENRIKRESNFLKKIIKENNIKTVLDCACGTGHHIIMLRQLGYEIEGSDLSPAMIGETQKNLKKYGIETTIRVSDFKNLLNNFKNTFDAILCIGNSLPHLLSEQEIFEALSSIYRLLNNKGILILEQRNYDKLVKNQERFFPVSFRENEVFFYVLDYYPSKIVFNVIDLETDNKKFKVFSTEYYPLFTEKLGNILKNLGFKDMMFYQDHEFNTFDKNSSDQMIIICQKQ